MPIWQLALQEPPLAGLGNQHLLAVPLLAFFASRQCSGAAIRAAMDWALAQTKRHQPVVSGFHSPLEQSVLKVLLQAGCPAVAVLARPVAEDRLPPDWAEPLAQDRMAVVGPATGRGRLTEALASQRNQWVAALAGDVVVAHASQGGQLAVQCQQWSAAGRRIRWLT